MNYEKLKQQLRNCKFEEFNRLLADFIPMGVDYLVKRYGADRDDAYDVVMQSYENMCQKVKDLADENKTLEHPDSYFYTTIKNTYLTFLQKHGRIDYQSEQLEYKEEFSIDAAHSIIEKEKIGILKECVKKLDDLSRSFIFYIYKNPDKSATQVGNAFKIKANNVFQRKHRIIKQLQDCVGTYL